MNLLSIILQATEGAEKAPAFNPQMLLLLAMFAVVFLFMIRPQMKRQKELKNFRESLKKGDKIVTSGGIYGKITSVDDTTVTLEIADGIKIKVDKNAVIKDPSELAQQGAKK
ncbi:MAG: preprotein translocase subunit YajC [Bacteroidales bacterium]|nr:preprotein translocase subunit YajC [Bacteroidales bacterium]